MTTIARQLPAAKAVAACKQGFDLATSRRDPSHAAAHDHAAPRFVEDERAIERDYHWVKAAVSAAARMPRG
jgi:hypothetical protein